MNEEMFVTWCKKIKAKAWRSQIHVEGDDSVSTSQHHPSY